MRRKTWITAVVVVGTCLVVSWLRHAAPSGAMAGAYMICGDCGLSTKETEDLVSTMRAAQGSREELLRSFCATFQERADAEPCEPCALAVLEAAGR